MNMARKELELNYCVTVNCAENCSVFKLLGSKKQHCPLHGSFITITLESTDCLLFFKLAPQSSEYFSVIQLLIYFVL